MPTKDQQKKLEFRKAVADRFLSLLDTSSENNDYKWIKQWTQLAKRPYNMSTDGTYRGINSLYLSLMAMKNGWSDPRWLTIAQMNRKYPGARVKKGEHSTKVEFCTYMLKDEDGKKTKVDGRTMINMIRSGEKEWTDFIFFHTYWQVFNAEQCTGLPEYKPDIPLNHNVSQSEYVSNVAKNLGIEIKHGGDGSYYIPAKDEIHLPNLEQFHSDYAYNSTALHELAHSTGNPKRLNRDLHGFFGSEDYAFEELVAELTSCMTSIEMIPDDEGMDEYLEKHSKNHMAYMKSWSKSITEDPTILEKAYKLAEQATDYIDLAGGALTLAEFQKWQPTVDVHLDEEGRILSTNVRKPEEKQKKVEPKKEEIEKPVIKKACDLTVGEVVKSPKGDGHRWKVEETQSQITFKDLDYNSFGGIIAGNHITKTYAGWEDEEYEVIPPEQLKPEMTEKKKVVSF